MTKFVSSKVASALCVAGIVGLASSVQAGITYNNTIAPYSGTGGNSSDAWVTGTDNGLALSLRAQYNNTISPPSNLTPNNGAGIFSFEAGTPTRAVWDFWFDVNPGATSTVGDLFVLSITSSLDGTPKIFNISSGFPPDNGHNGTSFQNAEDIGFSFIGYNPSLTATYFFTLTATDVLGNKLDSVNITVQNGGTPIPEPTTVTAAALLLLPFGGTVLRMIRRKQTA